MMDYELDRLFGLAMTDARFFRQLKEEPRQAAAQFELTELEMQAVMHIAPAVSSIEDLALQLDAWMESQPAVSEQIPDARPIQIPLGHISLGTQQSCLLSSDPNRVKTETRDGSGICLKLKAYAARS